MSKLPRHIGLTPRQAEVLSFIEDRLAEGGPAPSVPEILQGLGWQSTGDIARVLNHLEHVGFITRIPRTQRNIRLTSPNVRMASDEHLVAELQSRGYAVRKV